jgi:hypothetical protein
MTNICNRMRGGGLIICYAESQEGAAQFNIAREIWF